MPPALPTFPILSVGVLQIDYMDKTNNRQYLATGTVYLFSIDDEPNRSIVLGARHNLLHLINQNESVNHVKISFGNNFYCSVDELMGEEEGYRVVVSDRIGTLGDYGVAVLEKDVPDSIRPIPLQRVVQGQPINVVVAGCAEGNANNGDLRIFQKSVVAKTDVNGVVYYPGGTTDKGMSGGPVIIGDVLTAKAIGIVGGDGEIDDKKGNVQKCSLAKSIDDETIRDIRQLIEQARMK